MYAMILTMPLVLAFGADGLGDILGNRRMHTAEVSGASTGEQPEA